MSKPEPVPSRSIEVTSSSPAPRSTARSAQADGVETGRLAAALDHDLPGRRPVRIGWHDGARVDRDHDRLPAEPAGAAADERRVGDGRGVERDLVGARAEDVAHLDDGPHAAADGQRDERPPGRPLDDVEERAAPLGRRGDVEEDELVGALGGVALGELGRIALVDEVDEPGALDDPAVGDVEARDDAPAQHQAARTRSTKLASSRRPSGPLRSGWNWTPSNAPRATAETNAPPCSVVARITSSCRRRRARPTYEWTK